MFQFYTRKFFKNIVRVQCSHPIGRVIIEFSPQGKKILSRAAKPQETEFYFLRGENFIVTRPIGRDYYSHVFTNSHFHVIFTYRERMKFSPSRYRYRISFSPAKNFVKSAIFTQFFSQRERMKFSPSRYRQRISFSPACHINTGRERKFSKFLAISKILRINFRNFHTVLSPKKYVIDRFCKRRVL